LSIKEIKINVVDCRSLESSGNGQNEGGMSRIWDPHSSKQFEMKIISLGEF
jgi:hypothetical protein